MQIQVNVNTLNAITRDYLNENEYNVHKVIFDFAEEYSDSLVKVALFTQDGTTYKMMVENNQCDIPPEILSKKGTFILGVYAYEVQDEELILRYSPSPIKLFISAGSYIKDEDTENSEPITPTEMEQYEQILHDSITEMNIKLAEIDEAIEEANNLDIDVTKEGDTATITVTKKDGTPKSEIIQDGKDGKDGADGKDGKNGKDGQDGYTPQKGTDYWTQQDKEEIIEDVEEELVIPTKTSDLTNDSGFINNTVNNLINYELKTNTGSSIALSINPSTYVMTLQLKNSSGTVLSEGTIDLPLETMVVGATYDNVNKKIVLTLKNGTEVSFSVADLVSGLVDETTFNTAIQELQNNINAKYTKPNTGIPKTDLSNEVQTSLGKADTAIQEHQDLTDYVKNTDYATDSKGGVIKVNSSTFGFVADSNGNLAPTSISYADYSNKGNYHVISKGTLENVITGKNLETANNKTTTLDENSTDIQYPSAKAVYDNYKDIIKTNQEQAEEIEDLKKNRLTNTPEIATEIDLSDSADSKVVSMDLKGNSEQETTEGYQLFKLNDTEKTTPSGLTEYSVTDEEIILKGTTTSSGNLALPFNTFTLPAGSYTLVAYLTNTVSANSSQIILLKNGNDRIVTLNLWGGVKVVKNFTLEEDTPVYAGQYGSYLYANNNMTFDTKIKLMILSGTYTADNVPDWEKYTNGASPNPEYEQPIYSCGDNVNLLPNTATSQTINGVEFTVNDDGTVIANGTATAGLALDIATGLSILTDDLILSGCANGGSSSTYRIRATYTDNTYSEEYGNGYAFNNQKTLRAVTIIISSGTVCDNLVFKPKLEKGSTATPYSPYGMGSISEKIVNENLCYIEAEGKYRSYSTGNYVTTSDYNSYKAEVEAGVTYKAISFNSKPFSNICFFDKNMNYISGLAYTSEFTTVENCKYVTIAVSNTENQFMIVKGTTVPTSYEPHQEQNIIIPTQEPMRAIGEVRDDFVKQDGVWYERHYGIYEKITSEMVEGIILSSTYGNYINIIPNVILDKTTNKINVYSNIAIGISFENRIYNTNTYRIFTWNDVDKIALRFPVDSNITTVEQAKNFIDNHEMYALIKLAEPTLLPCTEEQITALEQLQKARTYKNVTHITSEDTVKPYIDMEYVQDLRTVINNLS